MSKKEIEKMVEKIVTLYNSDETRDMIENELDKYNLSLFNHNFYMNDWNLVDDRNYNNDLTIIKNFNNVMVRNEFFQKIDYSFNPVIFISDQAMKKINAMMYEYKNKEWGAFLVVKDHRHYSFYIEDIIFVPQVSNEAEVIYLDGEGFSFFEKNFDISLKKFRIHSHHRLGAFHSSTDREEFENYYGMSDFLSIVISTKNDSKSQLPYQFDAFYYSLYSDKIYKCIVKYNADVIDTDTSVLDKLEAFSRFYKRLVKLEKTCQFDDDMLRKLKALKPSQLKLFCDLINNGFDSIIESIEKMKL